MAGTPDSCDMSWEYTGPPIKYPAQPQRKRTFTEFICDIATEAWQFTKRRRGTTQNTSPNPFTRPRHALMPGTYPVTPPRQSGSRGRYIKSPISSPKLYNTHRRARMPGTYPITPHRPSFESRQGAHSQELATVQEKATNIIFTSQEDDTNVVATTQGEVPDVIATTQGEVLDAVAAIQGEVLEIISEWEIPKSDIARSQGDDTDDIVTEREAPNSHIATGQGDITDVVATRQRDNAEVVARTQGDVTNGIVAEREVSESDIIIEARGRRASKRPSSVFGSRIPLKLSPNSANIGKSTPNTPKTSVRFEDNPVSRVKKYVKGEMISYPSPISSEASFTSTSSNPFIMYPSPESPTQEEQDMLLRDQLLNAPKHISLEGMLATEQETTSTDIQPSGPVPKAAKSKLLEWCTADMSREEWERAADRAHGFTSYSVLRKPSFIRNKPRNQTASTDSQPVRSTSGNSKSEFPEWCPAEMSREGWEHAAARVHGFTSHSSLRKTSFIRDEPQNEPVKDKVEDLDSRMEQMKISRRAETARNERLQKHLQDKVNQQFLEQERKDKARAEERARIAREEEEERMRKAEKERIKNGGRRTPLTPVILPLSAEWEMKVSDALAKSKRNEQVASTSSGNIIKRSDIGRVVPQVGAGDPASGWLNDEIINAYLEAVIDHGHIIRGHRRGDIPKLHAFNNFFYNNLRDKGVDSVKRWAKRARIGGKDLLQVEYVFIPVNLNNAHWTLLVVSPRYKTIEYFDSMHGSAEPHIGNMKIWLKGELGNMYKEEEWKVVEDPVYIGKGKGQTQTNCSDCGVFAVTNARMISLGVEPMAIDASAIPFQRRRIIAELLNGGFHGDLAPNVVFG